MVSGSINLMLAQGNFLVPASMFGWVAAAVAIFALLPPRRAVIACVIIPWLFLPMAAYDIPGLPAYDKFTASAVGVLLGVFLFDSKRLFAIRLSWIDIPLLVWMTSPIVTSVLNGLGLHDGLSNCFTNTVQFGVPYLMGRLYFSDREGMRDLAIGFMLAGLVYLPFCLWELRMSPRLHLIWYGFRQHAFSQAKRGDGYRPMVFMQHGLAVSMLIGMAAVAAAWLWQGRAQKRFYDIPMGLIVAVIFGVTVASKSMLATFLTFLGVGAAIAVYRMRLRWTLILILAAAPTYMLTRGSGLWTGYEPLKLVEALGAPERVISMRTRLVSESFYIDKAWERPLFGWGGWSRGDLGNDRGRIDLDDGSYVRVIADAHWLIIWRKYGLIGLTSFTLMMLLPAAMVIKRLPRAAWFAPMFAPALAMVAIVSLHMCDNLMNAMPNPMFVFLSGSLSGIAVALTRLSAPRRVVATTRVRMSATDRGPRRLTPPSQGAHV